MDGQYAGVALQFCIHQASISALSAQLPVERQVRCPLLPPLPLPEVVAAWVVPAEVLAVTTCVVVVVAAAAVVVLCTVVGFDVNAVSVADFVVVFDVVVWGGAVVFAPDPDPEIRTSAQLTKFSCSPHPTQQSLRSPLLHPQVFPVTLKWVKVIAL